ncbi:hypothetical protein Mal52_28680 [Symmachiella dynata]|uniref:Uncharacterized protein n=1 Tax=Symmachiella dynata TaxID=2527995 RepID=A0A517ZPI2_9PLAN|nr:hypothetical protein [Symmachiella dynata]QDU44387.1 hypothetical protein Mal52_28680 [Symmachiella dynata]
MRRSPIFMNYKYAEWSSWIVVFFARIVAVVGMVAFVNPADSVAQSLSTEDGSKPIATGAAKDNNVQSKQRFGDKRVNPITQPGIDNEKKEELHPSDDHRKKASHRENNTREIDKKNNVTTEQSDRGMASFTVRPPQTKYKILHESSQSRFELMNPPGINDYTDYFKTMISVAGVLFGLAFAALLYVLQSGFSSFTVSRNMFLEHYVHFGGNLLVTLSYLTLISVGVAYFSGATMLLNIAYYIFCISFLKTRLDYLKQLGYIHTLNSKKYVPSNYGPCRRYFRYIKNLGFLQIGFQISVALILIVYPMVIAAKESGGFGFTPKAFFYSTMLVFMYCLIVTVRFIPNFFEILKIEYESDLAGDKNSEIEIDYQSEKKLLRKYLINHGVNELNENEKKEFLDGTISLNILDEKKEPEAWFNVHVHISDSNIVKIHNEVCRYAYGLFEKLNASQVDVNTFVLSFHIFINGDRRNMFFRSTRNELNAVLLEEPVSAILLIKNKVFDDIFQNMTQGQE